MEKVIYQDEPEFIVTEEVEKTIRTKLNEQPDLNEVNIDYGEVSILAVKDTRNNCIHLTKFWWDRDGADGETELDDIELTEVWTGKQIWYSPKSILPEDYFNRNNGKVPNVTPSVLCNTKRGGIIVLHRSNIDGKWFWDIPQMGSYCKVIEEKDICYWMPILPAIKFIPEKFD